MNNNINSIVCKYGKFDIKLYVLLSILHKYYLFST